MKMLIEYLPVVLFAGTYFATDIYTATAVFMVAATVLALGYRVIAGKWNNTHLIVAALALVFGSMTLVFHDPLFIKLKPTVLYALFAAVLVGSVFIGERPLMQRMLESKLELKPPVWQRLTFMWAAFFLFCAVLNLYIAFEYSEVLWVKFKLFGTFGLTIIFVIAQGFYLAQHLPKEEQS